MARARNPQNGRSVNPDSTSSSEDMVAYTFGWSEEDAVEVPNLDAFYDEFRALCKKHGVTFYYESYADDWGHSHVTLGPATDKALADIISEINFEEIQPGCKWLDKAKAEAEVKGNMRWRAKMLEKQAEELAAKRAQTEALLVEGVTLDGKRYRLVPQE